MFSKGCKESFDLIRLVISKSREQADKIAFDWGNIVENNLNYSAKYLDTVKQVKASEAQKPLLFDGVIFLAMHEDQKTRLYCLRLMKYLFDCIACVLRCL